jgi:hypothetical protein
MGAKLDFRGLRAVLGLAIMLLTTQLAAPHPAAAAPAPRAPEAMVAEVYHRLIAAESGSEGYGPPEDIYTPRLTALVAAARRKAKGEAACGLDFIFWFNGQDDRITQLVVTRGPTTPAGHTTVTATFHNMDDPEKIVFDFQKVGGRWLLDDAHSLVGDSQWTFSRLLQCKD